MFFSFSNMPLTLESHLFIQLAELWPSGFMDNHGIKRAICRAKERRRDMYSRDKVCEILSHTLPFPSPLNVHSNIIVRWKFTGLFTFGTCKIFLSSS